MVRFVLCALLILAGPGYAQERVPQSASEITLTFAPLVKRAAPAVVNIYAQRVVQARSPFSGDPFFNNFFRDFDARPRVQNSLGSGVILSEDGVVVSNYHVVGQATEIRVVLNDRREFEARVLLADEESDLAILKLEGAAEMPHLPLRDSDTVEVGELVLAIGNPFGVGQTVSSGIVSGLARSGTATGNGRGYFLQTDAPINPGNSGGALVDVAGQLIGVNTSILTRSGGSNGIGFAIPANLVAQFVEQARSGETRFQRPWAGVTGQSIDADLSQTLGLEVPGGVVLADLHPASPFRQAGLRSGDVVLQVDGQEVNTPAEMLFRMSVRGLGAAAQVLYARGEATAEASVQLIAPPEVPARDQIELGGQTILPGLVVARANPAVIADYGFAVNTDGIVVLDSGRLGGRVGLQRGDVLRRIGRAVVRAPADVAPLLLRAAPFVEVQALRNGRSIVLRFRT